MKKETKIYLFKVISFATLLISISAFALDPVKLTPEQNRIVDQYLGKKFIADKGGMVPSQFVEAVEEYDSEVTGFKVESENFFNSLHSELSAKKYPHAHFVKSVQSQISEKKFNNNVDFDNAREIISTLRGVDNKAIDKIILSEKESMLGSLSKLSVSFSEIKEGANKVAEGPKVVTPKKSTLDIIFKSFLLVSNIILGFLAVLFSQNLNLITGLAVLLLSAISVYFVVKSSRLAKENKKLSARDWSNLVNVKTKKSLQATYDSLDSLYICEVDPSDKIVFSNMAFDKTFGKYNDLTQFFSENLKSDKELRGLTNICKFVGDITNDYFINVSARNKNGIKTVFIHKFDSVMLTKIANSRKVNLEKNKVNATDLIEASLSRHNSFKSSSNLVFEESDYAESLYVYIPETQAQTLFDHYIRAVVAISRLKGCQSDIEIKMNRADNKYHLVSFFPEVSLMSKDFSQTIPFGGKRIDLGSALKEINQIVKGYEVSLVVKNIESSQRNGIHFEVIVSDLERVNVGAFEYSL